MEYKEGSETTERKELARLTPYFIASFPGQALAGIWRSWRDSGCLRVKAELIRPQRRGHLGLCRVCSPLGTGTGERPYDMGRGTLLSLGAL